MKSQLIIERLQLKFWKENKNYNAIPMWKKETNLNISFEMELKLIFLDMNWVILAQNSLGGMRCTFLNLSPLSFIDQINNITENDRC